MDEQRTILLFRHGIAVDRSDPDCPIEDADRFLTERGIERTRLAARGLAAVTPAPDLLIQSPYLRARQTADLLAEAFDLDDPRRETSAHLEPFGSIPRTLELLARSEARCVAVVGHAPHLDLLLAGLLGAGIAAPAWRLKKAGAALVEWSPEGSGLLRALHPPRHLRQLADTA